MKHVKTWLTIGEPGGTYSVSPADVAQWVDYTMTTPALSASAQAVGEKTILYSDPNRQPPGGPMWTQDESTFAHDCTGARISVSGSSDLLMDVHSTHLWALWPAFVALTQTWGGSWDYIFEDSADDINPVRLSAMPCNFDMNDWTANTNQMNSQLGSPILYNGLGLITQGSTSPSPAFGLNATTQGGMSEDCYVGRTPTGYYYAPHWEGTANTEIQMAQAGKLFMCHSDAYVDASQSNALRTYFYASFLLTYDRNTQVVITEFLTPSGVTVMPEQQLVPLNPVISTPGDISGLLEPSGVYGREYRDCYLAGNYVGPCASVVNPAKQGTHALAFPWPTKYHHTLEMSGYGVYDGGTVDANGPAPVQSMGGGTAQIVFP
jgi:hypothetical protein